MKSQILSSLTFELPNVLVKGENTVNKSTGSAEHSQTCTREQFPNTPGLQVSGEPLTAEPEWIQMWDMALENPIKHLI